MPVYEYQCTSCEQDFELFVPQRMSAEGVVCRECHSPNVRKKVSSFASLAGESTSSIQMSQPASGGGCCGGAGGCACGH